MVRTMIAGIPHTLTPRGRAFEGWGIFRVVGYDDVALLEEAGLSAIDAYLELFPPARLRLVRQMRGGTWLAFPMSPADALRCGGTRGPVAVHLVNGCGRFDAVAARFDGSACWFDTLDRRADPMIADALRDAAARSIPAVSLRISGLSPEDRAAYSALFEPVVGGRTDERRLRRALELGGGSLHGYHDRGEFWLVEWRTPDGELHTSAIRKGDLTVIGAGICLSDHDRDFDLQSLVGVVHDRPDWMR
jgi:hypothetical protein